MNQNLLSDVWVSKRSLRKPSAFFTALVALSISTLGMGSAASSGALSTADVSILYPLPKGGSWEGLLSPQSAPELLPFEVFRKVHFLINQPDERTYPDLRVVGVRIDPCFVEGSGPRRCQAQVRFVWQPLKLVDGLTSTVDASVHTFFHLTEAEFKVLVERLKNLREGYSAPAQTLGVHPILAQLGLKSEFARDLNNLWLEAISGKTLARMTFMKLKGVDDFWVFGGVDAGRDGFKQIAIPRLQDAFEQEFINQMALRPDPKQFMGGIFPAPDEGSALDLITKDSLNAQDLSQDQLSGLMRTVADFDHPQRHNPGTLDCVSCHLGNMMHGWLQDNFASHDLGKVYDEAKYQNPDFDLSNSSPRRGQTNVLRMFGYFGRDPIVAQRTINESAEVAGAINRAMTNSVNQP